MRLIAYYLPQFHPIPENDEWWGEGFTEWTNVRKAKQLYKGHLQPKVPSELGYYDLRLPEIRESQAQMAKDAGIEGFCYWHYWFGNGKQLLDRPFKEVVKSKSPNFPFCLGWANESWRAKVWNATSGEKDRILIDQLYPGESDTVAHFYSLLEAFQDDRYITVEGKPLFVIYKPQLLPEPRRFMDTWNNLAVKEGLSGGIFFVGHTNISKHLQEISDLGFDAVNIVRIGDCTKSNSFRIKNIPQLIRFKFMNKPYILDYKKAMYEFTKEIDKLENVFPSLLPNWDHTPRSGKNGLVLHNSTPSAFGEHVESVLNSVVLKEKEKQIVFIKSWNEWGEGNYLEPDTLHGREYLDELKRILLKFKSKGF